METSAPRSYLSRMLGDTVDIHHSPSAVHSPVAIEPMICPRLQPRLQERPQQRLRRMIELSLYHRHSATFRLAMVILSHSTPYLVRLAHHDVAWLVLNSMGDVGNAATPLSSQPARRERYARCLSLLLLQVQICQRRPAYIQSLRYVGVFSRGHSSCGLVDRVLRSSGVPH